MALTFEQWKKTLDTVNPNKGDIFEQIKVRLEAENTDTYQEWERKEFDINHLFSILLTIGSCQNNVEFELFLNLFRIAAYNGHLDMVKHLAALGNVKVDEKDNNGNTALHLAASNGHLETVKYLIEQGIDVHAKNQFGEAALHLAASNGYLETVKYLIEQGANVEERNNWNTVALHLAASNGHLETVKYLIKQGIDIDIESGYPLLTIHFIRFLSHVAKGGNTSIAKVLEGFDVKVQSERGDENLLLTTMHSHIDIVKALIIVAGVDCTFNQIKKTPMFLAAWSGHTGVMKALAKAGADVNVQDGNHGETFLHWNDYNYIQQETGVTLMNCWDFEDVKEKHVPKLKLMTFVQSIENKDISSNLECSNTEQLQELHRAFN